MTSRQDEKYSFWIITQLNFFPATDSAFRPATVGGGCDFAQSHPKKGLNYSIINNRNRRNESFCYGAVLTALTRLFSLIILNLKSLSSHTADPSPGHATAPAVRGRWSPAWATSSRRARACKLSIRELRIAKKICVCSFSRWFPN